MHACKTPQSRLLHARLAAQLLPVSVTYDEAVGRNFGRPGWRKAARGEEVSLKRRTFRLLPASTGLSYVRLIGGRLLLTRRAQARCATHHKLCIQSCKDRADRQIATLFERAA